MKKYNEDDLNFVKLENYNNDIFDDRGIERKQLDMCKGNIIFCHVDCFCLQEKKGR